MIGQEVKVHFKSASHMQKPFFLKSQDVMKSRVMIGLRILRVFRARDKESGKDFGLHVASLRVTIKKEPDHNPAI